MVNIARELGMRLYNDIGYYFPQEIGFDSKYFLEFLSGRKKVSISNNNCYSFSHWEEQEDIALNISEKTLYSQKNIF